MSGGKTDSRSATSVVIPSPVSATSTWVTTPKRCPHCNAPIAQHPTEDAADETRFVCGDQVVHVRRKPGGVLP